MATKPSTTKTQNDKQDDAEATNPGTPAPEATDTADTAVARAAGITEGEVKALRDDAGVNQSAGHESDIHAWAATEAGKKFAKETAKENEKAAKDEEKAYKDSLNDDGLDEAAVKYREAVDKA